MTTYVNGMTPLEAISQIIQETLVSLRYADTPLLSIVAQDARTTRQKNIRWNVNTSTDFTGAIRLASADANSATSDNIENANLSIGQYAFTRTVSLDPDEIEQAAVAGIGELRNLVNQHFKTKLIQIRLELNSVLYNGTGNAASAGIKGLDVVAAQSGDYAGIDGTGNAWKGGFVLENGGTNRSLTKDLLYSADDAMFNQGTGSAKVIVTTKEIITNYKKLFDDERAQYTPNNVAGNVDLAHSSASWNGIPMVADRACPVGQMYFLDTDYLSLYTYDYTDRSGLVTMPANGMVFTMADLPENNMYAKRFEVGTKAQLQVEDRRAVGVIKDITQ